MDRELALKLLDEMLDQVKDMLGECSDEAIIDTMRSFGNQIEEALKEGN